MIMYDLTTVSKEFFPESQVLQQGKALILTETLDLIEQISFIPSNQSQAFKQFFAELTQLIEELPLAHISTRANFYRLMVANLPKYYAACPPGVNFHFAPTELDLTEVKIRKQEVISLLKELGAYQAQGSTPRTIELKANIEELKLTFDLKNLTFEDTLTELRLNFKGLPTKADAKRDLAPLLLKLRQAYKSLVITCFYGYQDYHKIHTTISQACPASYQSAALDDYLYAACHHEIHLGYQALAGKQTSSLSPLVISLAKFYTLSRLYLSLPYLKVDSRPSYTMSQAYKLSQSFEQFVFWQGAMFDHEVYLRTKNNHVFHANPYQPVALALERNLWYYFQHRQAQRSRLLEKLKAK